MAPSKKVAKTTKDAKGSDLRMFFGPGGSQPKPVPVATSSQVSAHHRRARRVFHLYTPSHLLLGPKRRVGSLKVEGKES